jgi:hypothetical protein
MREVGCKAGAITSFLYSMCMLVSSALFEGRIEG